MQWMCGKDKKTAVGVPCGCFSCIKGFTLIALPFGGHKMPFYCHKIASYGNKMAFYRGKVPHYSNRR